MAKVRLFKITAYIATKLDDDLEAMTWCINDRLLELEEVELVAAKGVKMLKVPKLDVDTDEVDNDEALAYFERMFGKE